MRQAGLKAVRLAEFAWEKIEPDDGIFDFSWLDDAIELLRSEGLQVVLGTPTFGGMPLANTHYALILKTTAPEI